MIKKKLAEEIGMAAGQAGLNIKVAEIELTRPDARFGDFSTNIALKVGKSKRVKELESRSAAKHKDKQTSLEFAKILADSLKKSKLVEKLEVKEPGFINIFIKKDVWLGQIADILDADDKYGSSEIGRGKKARVEFISANPTGPLHFGNARGGPIGDSISRVLKFCSMEVLREYLDNNRGNQVRELGKTLAVRAGLVKPEGELIYRGEYTQELADRLKEKVANLKLKSEEEIIDKFGELGIDILFGEIINDAASMGINFDHIVHENELQERAPKILEEFRQKNLLLDKDGAVWFAPRNKFLQDREAVVVKSDGTYTYFAADIVYHKEKFESGYDLIVDVFGSNTSGHVPKLQALVSALGHDVSRLKIILYQFVRLKRGNEVVKMSKRAGDFVTAKEVLDEVGSDAFRFFILMHDPNTHMDFDLALAKEHSSKNPVYYVQYAHARIASILSKADGKQLTAESLKQINYQLLTTDFEHALIKKITELPDLVEEIAVSFAVHRLCRYALDLADVFHKFYENCPVMTETEELKGARLVLCRATQIALANTLSLLGVSAPKKM